MGCSVHRNRCRYVTLWIQRGFQAGSHGHILDLRISWESAARMLRPESGVQRSEILVSFSSRCSAPFRHRQVAAGGVFLIAIITVDCGVSCFVLDLDRPDIMTLIWCGDSKWLRAAALFFEAEEHCQRKGAIDKQCLGQLQLMSVGSWHFGHPLEVSGNIRLLGRSTMICCWAETLRFLEICCTCQSRSM